MARMKLQQKQDIISTLQGFDDFLQNCRLKNLSQATIKGYRHHFVKFFQFYGEDADITLISQRTINEFILYLQDTLNNPETINTALRHFRAVMNYWAEQGYCQRLKVTMLRVQQKIKECYTEEELKILLKKPNIKQCSFAEYRNWVVINTLIATGMRLGSLVSLSCGDIDLENGCMSLQHTKNKRPQVLHIPNCLIPILKEYLRHRGGIFSDPLFPSELGNRMSSDNVSHAIRLYNRSRGLDKTSSHLFRHTFAKNWVLMGGDVFRLQKQLGHSTLEMSKRYANIYDTDLQKGTEQFNLLEKLKAECKTIKMVK